MKSIARSWLFLGAVIWAASCGEEGNDPIGGSTQRISCKTTADCKAVGGQCQASVCRADNECKADADCAAGEICIPDKSFGGLCGVKGSTPTPGPAWTCKADTDCPAGQECKAGQCVVPASKPTPTAEICDNNKDDDGDGLTDCKDTDCEREPPCQKTPPVTKTACHVLQQNCSAAGSRCWPGGEYAKDGICFPAGPMKQGDPCQEPPVDGPQACGKGLVCVAADSTSTPICRSLCGSSADCSQNEVCAKLDLGGGSTTKDYGVCVAAPTPPPPPPPTPCDVFKQDCSSGADMCVPQKSASNTCVPKGSAAAGSACSAATDCAPTLMCADLAGTSGSTLYFGFGYVRGGTCLPLCFPAAPTCPAGTTCSPVLSTSGPRTDIGVCAK